MDSSYQTLARESISFPLREGVEKTSSRLRSSSSTHDKINIVDPFGKHSLKTVKTQACAGVFRLNTAQIYGPELSKMCHVWSVWCVVRNTRGVSECTVNLHLTSAVFIVNVI